jgi:hypothetical protein
MSDAQDYMVPKPVAVTMEHFGELSEAYCEFRAVDPPTEALAMAFEVVLDVDEHRDVLAFLEGEADEIYGDGAGRQFFEKFLDTLESYYDDVSSTEEKLDRWRKTTDIVALAEEVATDRHTTHGFRRAVEAQQQRSANEMVDEVVSLLLTKANAAWTRTGKRVKVDQAAKVFSVLGTKAARVPDDEDARSQALWCAAVVDRLRRL